MPVCLHPHTIITFGSLREAVSSKEYEYICFKGDTFGSDALMFSVV